MKRLLLASIIFSCPAWADTPEDNNCKAPQSGTASIMMDEMSRSMRIDTDSIVKEKTTTELIYNNPITNRLASQYALQSYNEAPNNWTSLKSYKEIFSEHNVRNLIIKFTFENKEKKQNVFLVSTLASDDECSVRFNGYIIVKREF
ncbi:Putative shiga-like toxin A subunit [Erwinia billingiae Eb661]|uniref:Putative shiga-like toxin A subunit n=1 Tax=Erwinia billingiae (strain Eb661) TaxID=634500 RepID=D8MQ02_ERWBE|nr:hypothetical protein [Erwinia billingiae]CAX58909.1 Putative shiga-like toxin A subunit [Erwinia billingiae Eb661]